MNWLLTGCCAACTAGLLLFRENRERRAVDDRGGGKGEEAMSVNGGVLYTVNGEVEDGPAWYPLPAGDETSPLLSSKTTPAVT